MATSRGLWLGAPVGLDGLASALGASLVGYDGTTLLAIADNARPLANYAALRNYSGSAVGVKITDIATGGLFQQDTADTTSADNGATVIVDALGRRWKRLVYGTSSSSFASLSGAPEDNTALALALSGKQARLPFTGSPTAFLASDGTFRVPVGVGGGGSGGASAWGAIGGSLTDQEDLRVALNNKEPRLPIVGTAGQYLRGDRVFADLTPAAVGLANVNNTADSDKPVSSAQAQFVSNAIAAAVAASSGTGSLGPITTATITSPSGAGESGAPVPLLRYLRRSPSSIDYSEQRYDEEGNSYGNNTNTVQDWPLSKDFGTLEAAQAVFPFVTSLDDQRDWAELQAAIYSGNTNLLPSDGEGRWLNINRAVYCGAEFTKFVNKRCRIYTGNMTHQVINDGDAPDPDLSYPDVANDELGPVRGSVFIFTDLAIEPDFSGIELDSVRFGVTFLAGAVRPNFCGFKAHRSNALVFCYSGDMIDPLFAEASGDELGTMLISSATAYPADHPETGSASNVTYGITSAGHDFTPKVYVDFNTWFRDSIFRPNASSVTASGTSTYTGTDINATGRKVYVPRRNAQTQTLNFVSLSSGTLTTNSLVQLSTNTVIDWGSTSVAPTPAPPAPAPSPSPSPAPSPTPANTTFAYLDFSDFQDNQRQSVAQNKAANGAIYRNWGTGQVVGGKGDPFGPYVGAIGCYTDSSEGNRIAIVSDVSYSITGAMTLENHARIPVTNGSGDGTILSFSETGLQSDNTFIRIFANDPGSTGKRTFSCYFKALGITETITTPAIDPITQNGQTCYHIVVQRETNGTFTVRMQGNLVVTTTAAFVGTIQGYYCPWGIYRQGDQGVDSIFRGTLGFARGSRAALYSGATYTVPTTAPALT
jgi:hypothetical protein